MYQQAPKPRNQQTNQTSLFLSHEHVQLAQTQRHTLSREHRTLKTVLASFLFFPFLVPLCSCFHHLSQNPQISFKTLKSLQRNLFNDSLNPKPPNLYNEKSPNLTSFYANQKRPKRTKEEEETEANEGGRGDCPILSNIEPKQIKIRSESKHIKWRPPRLGIKQDWLDKIKNIRIGRKEAEDLNIIGDANMAIPFYDENLHMLNLKNDLEAKASESIPSGEGLAAATKDPIPPSSVLKQLALAFEFM